MNLRAVLACSVGRLTPGGRRDLRPARPGPGRRHQPGRRGQPRRGAARRHPGLLRQLTAAHLVTGAPCRAATACTTWSACTRRSWPTTTDAPAGRPATGCSTTTCTPRTRPRCCCPRSATRSTSRRARPGVVARATRRPRRRRWRWFTAEHPVLLAVDPPRRGRAGSTRTPASCPGRWPPTSTGRVTGTTGSPCSRRRLEAARRLVDRPAQAQAHRLLAGAYSNLRPVRRRARPPPPGADLFDELGTTPKCAHVHFDIAMLFDRQGSPREALSARPAEPRALPGGREHRSTRPWRSTRSAGTTHSSASTGRPSATASRRWPCRRGPAAPYGQANTWDSLGLRPPPPGRAPAGRRLLRGRRSTCSGHGRPARRGHRARRTSATRSGPGDASHRQRDVAAGPGHPRRARPSRRRRGPRQTALIQPGWATQGRAYSGTWQTASTLLPSGSRTKAPK